MTIRNQKYILMFPGQGSQYVNMGSFLMENKKYNEYFRIAGEIFGQDLADIIQDRNGMGSCLENTQYSQITIYALSCAICDFLFNEKGIDKKSVLCVLGHSLGDFSALYCSGAYDFKKGAEIVSYRGKIMAEASEKQNGDMMMAAVLGCDIEVITDVIDNFKNRVFIANINDYKQTVISGYGKEVIEAAEKLKSLGAKRVIPLKVNIASHCPLMNDVSSSLANYLGGISSFNETEISFFSSTELKWVQKAQITQMLVSQLLNPVKWLDSIEIMAERFLKNPDKDFAEVSFIEVGPGKVLSGLVKRILAVNSMTEIGIYNTDSIDEIERINI